MPWTLLVHYHIWRFSLHFLKYVHTTCQKDLLFFATESWISKLISNPFCLPYNHRPFFLFCNSLLTSRIIFIAIDGFFVITLFQALFENFLARLRGQCLWWISRIVMAGSLGNRVIQDKSPGMNLVCGLRPSYLSLLLLMVVFGNHWKNQRFYKDG